MNAYDKAVIVLDLLGEECTPEAIQNWLASGDPRPLPAKPEEPDDQVE